jgi:hypothetical protein
MALRSENKNVGQIKSEYGPGERNNFGLITLTRNGGYAGYLAFRKRPLGKSAAAI